MLNNIQKTISIISIIIILSILSIPVKSNAATYTQTVKSGIDVFPESYKTYLRNLKEQHPNWTFDAYYTGIDWNTAIESEYGPHTDPKNRIKTTDNSKKCGCTFLKSGCYCASKGTIEYYMDPRNFLTEVNIFQFSEMSFNSKVHTLATVKSIVKGTFLENYAQDIYDAAKESGISPFSIRAKIIQEVTKPGSGGKQGTDSVTGKYPGYEGLYNFYNYGANDTGNAIVNALEYARQQGWTTPRKSIVEGAKLMGSSYVNAGQNTAYFYKFDVVGRSILTSGKTQNVDTSMLFKHQYMTNIVDPYSQSITLYNMYSKNNVLDSSINFIIPVYNNMPGESQKPSGVTGDVYWVDVQDSLTLRSEPKLSGSKVGSLSRGDKVAMLQRNCAQADGYSWDKIKTASGTVCYVAGKYLKKEGSSTTNNTNNSSQQTNFTKDDTNKQIKAESNVTIENLKTKYGNKISSIKNKDGKDVTSGKIGTGTKVTIEGVVHTVIKYGDLNGDGDCDAIDLLLIKRKILGTYNLTNESKLSGDLNKDNVVDAIDLLLQKRNILGTQKISL